MKKSTIWENVELSTQRKLSVMPMYSPGITYRKASDQVRTIKYYGSNLVHYVLCKVILACTRGVSVLLWWMESSTFSQIVDFFTSI